MRNKNKDYKKVIDLILEKKDVEARTELKRVMLKNEKYIAYKKQLSEMGLNYEEVDVPEEVYFKIENALKDFHPNAQKKIIDNVYIDICEKQKGN